MESSIIKEFVSHTNFMYDRPTTNYKLQYNTFYNIQFAARMYLAFISFYLGFGHLNINSLFCYIYCSIRSQFHFTKFILSVPQTAFRTKAMQYHPDQNQDNRGMPLPVINRILLTPTIALLILGCENLIEASEAKFKEVMCSYEAIQKERKNQNL